jgi:hypothetical protein
LCGCPSAAGVKPPRSTMRPLLDRDDLTPSLDTFEKGPHRAQQDESNVPGGQATERAPRPSAPSPRTGAACWIQETERQGRQSLRVSGTTLSL